MMKVIFSIFFCILLTSCSTKNKEDTTNNTIIKLEEHIEARLKVKDKPTIENPYIYYLDIGDIYLTEKKVDRALEYYLKADSKEVNKSYVNHRLRKIADFHLKNKNYDLAIEHLQKFKHRDELLFGLMLDRVARVIVESEETK